MPLPSISLVKNMKTRGTISIIGGESLAGQELRELISDLKLPVTTRLLGVDEDTYTLTAEQGEAAVITPLDEEALTRTKVAVLAGSPESSRRVIELVARSAGGPALVDMTYAAEDLPSSRLRAPMVEPPGYAPPPGTIHVIAHPAAIALALLFSRLAARFRIRRSSAHIFEPASERGRRGLDELRKQTVSLLSFQPLEKEVFDAQAGFNLLSRYGEDAPFSLESVELRIERHLASLISDRIAAPLPSLRLVQAPVFHGYSISVHVEFIERPQLESLFEALEGEHVDVRTAEMEPPTNVGVAGQGGVAVGSIAHDRNEPNSCWFWMAADNIRLPAENALAVAQSLLDAEV